MELLTTLFFLLLAILAYTYFGYGAIISVLNLFVKKKPYSFSNDEELPEITVLIAAYNEQDCIVEKLANTRNLNYPTEKLNVWVVTDGSTDLTPRMVAAFPKAKLFHQPQRRGKLHAVDRVMAKVQTPITVFTDANTMLNADALLALVHPFADEKTGVVAGEKKVISDNGSAEATEGIYWKYESYLKKISSRFHSATGAAGELFAIRTELFEPVPSDTLIEDFVLSLQIASKGYRIGYAEKAVASELPSASVAEEQKRKVRIAAGGLQAAWRMRKLYNPFKYGWLSFQLFSHRILRWTLAPLALPLLLIVNGLILVQNANAHPFFGVFFLLQMICYALAGIGSQIPFISQKSKLLFVPYYFMMMNACVYKGFLRLWKGSQSVVWEKAQRQAKGLNSMANITDSQTFRAA